jgi:hypothetical protein
MLQRAPEEAGMLSKSIPVALTTLVSMIFLSCSSAPPWSHEDPTNEVNLAFTIQNNLLFLQSTTINHQPGRIFFASAAPQSAVDPAYRARIGETKCELDLNKRAAIPFAPVVLDLHGVADALIGSDVWGTHAVTIDYRSGLLTYQKDGIHPDYMTIYRFDAAPTVKAKIDGRDTLVVVDTALPDTIVLPRGSAPAGRRVARVVIAGTDFGNVDIALGDVSSPRVGNRMLSKFLVSIDYGRREVGLWRDPRIGM